MKEGWGGAKSAKYDETYDAEQTIEKPEFIAKHASPTNTFERQGCPFTQIDAHAHAHAHRPSQNKNN